MPYSHTPCLQQVDRDYSEINLIFGNERCPYQLEINSCTGKMEIHPVRTEIVLNDNDKVCRISHNELFIYMSELNATYYPIIYNLNSQTYKKLPEPLKFLEENQICYFKNCIYDVHVIDNNSNELSLETQRYNLLTGKWECTGKIYYVEFIDKLIPGQSKLYAIGMKKYGGYSSILVFNEEKKRWEYCDFLSLNFIRDISTDYCSDDLILYGKPAQENEVYLYNVNKGDLAVPFSIIGKHKPFKYPLGVINIDGTYIKFGKNDEYGSLELQYLDPRREEEIASHGMKNINWSELKSSFNKFSSLVFKQYNYTPQVLPKTNRKED